MNQDVSSQCKDRETRRRGWEIRAPGRPRFNGQLGGESPELVPRWHLLALVVMAACVPSCSAYYGGYWYRPDHAIHEVQVLAPAGAPPAIARVDVEIVGLLRPEDGKPRRLHVRLALDNPAAATVVFDPATATLFAGSAGPYPAEGSAATEVKPRESRIFDLLFPVPRDATLGFSLQNIVFHWTLRIGEVEHKSSARFDRYHDPYYWHGHYGPPWPHYYYFGYSHCHW